MLARIAPKKNKRLDLLFKESFKVYKAVGASLTQLYEDVLRQHYINMNHVQKRMQLISSTVL
jgi:hypothetical protein